MKVKEKDIVQRNFKSKFVKEHRSVLLYAGIIFLVSFLLGGIILLPRTEIFTRFIYEAIQVCGFFLLGVLHNLMFHKRMFFLEGERHVKALNYAAVLAVAVCLSLGLLYFITNSMALLIILASGGAFLLPAVISEFRLSYVLKHRHRPAIQKPSQTKVTAVVNQDEETQNEGIIDDIGSPYQPAAKMSYETAQPPLEPGQSDIGKPGQEIQNEQKKQAEFENMRKLLIELEARQLNIARQEQEVRKKEEQKRRELQKLTELERQAEARKQLAELARKQEELVRQQKENEKREEEEKQAAELLQAELKKQEELARQEEEKKRKEEQMKQEQIRHAELERQAEEQRQAELKSQEEIAKQQEEEKKKEEENRHAELERRPAEQHQVELKRQEEIAKQKAEDIRKEELDRQAELKRRVEAWQQAESQRKLAAIQRQSEIDIKKEQQKKQAELQEQAEIDRLAEVKRRVEAWKLAELKKLQDAARQQQENKKRGEDNTPAE